MSAKPKHTQSDLFPAGEGPPFFSGVCVKAQPATFHPREVWRQTSILDLPEFLVVWEHRHEYYSCITLARLLGRLGCPHPLAVIAAVDSDPGRCSPLGGFTIYRLDSPHKPTDV